MWSISTTVTCTPESFTSEASNAPPAVSIRPQEWVKMSPGPWQSMSTSRGSSMTYGIVTSTNCSREELETFRYETPYNIRHQNYNLLIVTSRNGTTGFLLSFFVLFCFRYVDVSKTIFGCLLLQQKSLISIYQHFSLQQCSCGRVASLQQLKYNRPLNYFVIKNVRPEDAHHNRKINDASSVIWQLTGCVDFSHRILVLLI